MALPPIRSLTVVTTVEEQFTFGTLFQMVTNMKYRLVGQLLELQLAYHGLRQKSHRFPLYLVARTCANGRSSKMTSPGCLFAVIFGILRFDFRNLVEISNH